jgi:FkbM family methyltransferase
MSWISVWCTILTNFIPRLLLVASGDFGLCISYANRHGFLVGKREQNSSMHKNVLKFFRSVQIHFPYLQDLKFDVQRTFRSVLDQTHEKEFELIDVFASPDNNTFIDIGANRGDAIHSILMRQPESKIFAFEPNAYLAGKLKYQYGNNHRVKIFNYGLGDVSSRFDLFVPFYNNYMFDGLASFKEANARDWLKNRLFGFNENKLEVKKVLCHVKRLDEFELKPCFIKIDVQGFEYEVLKGAEETIRNSRPVILMESPAHRELDFLYSLEYQPFILKGDKLRSGTKNYNVFFIPEEAIVPLQKKYHIQTPNRQAA